jgi:hypothetical protein
VKTSGNLTWCILPQLPLFCFSHVYKIQTAKLDRDTKLTQWLSHLFITNAGPSARDGFIEGIWNEKKWCLVDCVNLLSKISTKKIIWSTVTESASYIIFYIIVTYRHAILQFSTLKMSYSHNSILYKITFVREFFSQRVTVLKWLETHTHTSTKISLGEWMNILNKLHLPLADAMLYNNTMAGQRDARTSRLYWHPVYILYVQGVHRQVSLYAVSFYAR